ncbi:hypothetical protein AM291 [Anaplasma marginale str. St. Maries]|nr:hypothetical protein AM291 [Anaplasma marginale str. St. Maries]
MDVILQDHLHAQNPVVKRGNKKRNSRYAGTKAIVRSMDRLKTVRAVEKRKQKRYGQHNQPSYSLHPPKIYRPSTHKSQNYNQTKKNATTENAAVSSSTKALLAVTAVLSRPTPQSHKRCRTPLK